jgi:hypothetical protein
MKTIVQVCLGFWELIGVSIWGSLVFPMLVFPMLVFPIVPSFQIMVPWAFTLCFYMGHSRA